MVARHKTLTAPPRNVVLRGDALTVLRTLPDTHVQCVITSPPYLWRRDYSNAPVVFGGVSTCRHQWGKPLPPKKANQKAQSNINGRQNAVSIAEAQKTPMGIFCERCHAWRGHLGNEPTIPLYIEHLLQIFREVALVMRPDATLWINLGDGYSNNTKWGGQSSGKNSHSIAGGYAAAGRQHSTSDLPPKSLMLIPSRFAIAMQDEGWVLRSDIIWKKPNALPESVSDRCTMNYEHLFLFSKGQRYYFDATAIKEPVTGGAHVRGNGVTPKSAEPVGEIRANDSFHAAMTQLVASRNARSVWHINAAQFADAHFATFALELPERCILAGSHVGDLVIDPFADAGTTLMRVQRLGRDYLGIEINAEYIRMAEDRIARDPLPAAMKHVDLALVPPRLFPDSE